MPSVRVREGESFDSAIRRFKRAVEKAGIPKELRRREFHQKGSTLKQRRIAAARKRLLKKLAREKSVWEHNARDRRH
jgi:small subunit ribosomal protein S21